MYHIEREIAEQPVAINRLINEEAENVANIVKAIREFDPTFVMIAARGTSDNAARYAQYLMGIRAGLPVSLATPSVHTLYHAAPNLSRALVIGISQSGSAADVNQVLSDARQQGSLTLAITNNPDSLMAQTADHHIFLRCGEEISVAATKTYTAQLTAVALLTSTLVNDAEMQADLQALPAQVANTIEMAQGIPNWIERYRYIDRIAVIGRGYNYCTAFETSLKIKELCYITGEEYSEADFRHGPIAMIERGFPVILIAPQGKPYPLLLDLLKVLNERGAECIVISNMDEVAAYAQKHIPLPAAIPEWTSPVNAIIPGQIFAMNLALAKGHSVDQPQGLTKVTVTR